MEDIKIYEVPHFIQEAMEASLDEDGNLDQEIYQDMIDLILGSEPVEKKLDGIRYHLMNIEQNRDLAKSEHDRLAKTINAYDRQEANLKKYIMEIMNVSNIKALDTGTVVFRSIVKENGDQDITLESEPLLERKFKGSIISNEVMDILLNNTRTIEDTELYDLIMSIAFKDNQSFPDKLNTLRDCMLKFSSKSDFLKKEKKKMTEDGKIASERADKIKEIINLVFKKTNLEKLDTGICKFGFRKSKSLRIEDVSLLPKEFTRIKPATIEADKMALKKAIKEGMVFEGVDVIEKKTISMK